MVTDEGIDWWSKYHASLGTMDKCKLYVELGYDKLQARDAFATSIFIIMMKNFEIGEVIFVVSIQSAINPSLIFSGF